MSEQRYAIASDDSGHQYYVRVEKLDEFYEWVENFDPYQDDDEPPHGERIDGKFTFTDPRCDYD